MRAGRSNRVAMRRSERLGAAIFGLLLAIFVVRWFVDTPGLSIVFLAAFPIVLAAFALGRDAAIACGALAGALSVIVSVAKPGTDVSTSAQVVGGVFRTVVFVGLGALVAILIERSAALRRRLADAQAEVRELESLRAALTSPDLPAVEGLSIATSYTPADGPVAGDFFLVAPAWSDAVRGLLAMPRPASSSARRPRATRCCGCAAPRRTRSSARCAAPPSPMRRTRPPTTSAWSPSAARRRLLSGRPRRR